MSDLRVTVGDEELTAEWAEENPDTRAAVAESLPIGGNATRWGEELYVMSGVDVPAESTRSNVEPGALAYWPQGNAICLFWGPTPASAGEKPRAASPVNVFAHADLSGFEPGSGGARLRLEVGD
ncbi:MAG: cyclophilin-like family protein [Halobacteriota archaeon]|uniref:cyclophilin-like family protein n=1 Tax=Natronomonas sp. TaxID=2184060 RepID=UPI0039747C69